MAENIEAKIVDGEASTSQEKEKAVLENAGINITEENGIHKIDLSMPPPTKEEPQEDAVQEQSTDEVPVRNEP